MYRNQIMESNTENSICNALSIRVNELFPFGIENIWMKAIGRDRYHVTNVQGISRDEWDLAIPFSGLFTRRENQLKCDVWSMKLKLKVEFNDFVTSDEFGKHDQCKWFRFVGPLSTFAQRSSRKRSSSTIVEADSLLIPCSLQAEAYLNQYYLDLEASGMVRSRVFRNPEMVAFLRAKRRQLSQQSFVEEVDAEIDISSSLINTVTPSKSLSDKKEEFINGFFEAPLAWQHAIVTRYLKDNSAGNKFTPATFGADSGNSHCPQVAQTGRIDRSQTGLIQSLMNTTPL